MDTTRSSTLKRPNQVRPTKSERNTWKSNIRKLCHIDNILITSLDTWTGPSHQIWKYMLSSNELLMLQESTHSQTSHGRLGRDKFFKQGRHEERKIPGIPIRCNPIATGFRRVETSVDYIKIRTRKTMRRNEHKSLTKTLGHVWCPNKAKLSRLWAKQSKWIVATDGSLKDRLGTSGVVLYNLETKEEICAIQTAETCKSGKLDSTREELRGNLAAEIKLNQIGDKFGSGVEQEVQYVSDRRNALLKIQRTTIHPLEPEYDVTVSIIELKRDNENITRTYIWVKDHQDKDRKTIQEKSNDRAYELATISRQTPQLDYSV